MSQKLRDKLVIARTLKAFRSSRHYWLWYCSIGSLCIVGMAVLFHGCEAREIRRPTPQMDVVSQFWVRVLLTANATECTLKAPSILRAHRAGLSDATGIAEYGSEPLPDVTTVAVSGGRLTLAGSALPWNEVIINPEHPHIINLNGSDYRGKVHLILNADGRTFDIINLVPLEPYLAGVVGAEMPDYWEPEALKAQAVAARTYCLYIKNRFGVNRRWDVSRTQASQVYLGVGGESAQTWNVVNSTYGKVLVSKRSDSGSSVGGGIGTAGLFPTYYSSVCGGHTEDSERVFGDSFEPLHGVACPYCKDVAKLGVFFWPMAQFDRATVVRRLVEKYPKLGALGDIRDLQVADSSEYGGFSRLTRIRVVGSTGKSETLRAEDLRLTVDPTGRKIRSTLCQIVKWGDGWAFLSGRGWGHGVGLCQCGAEGLARRGKKMPEILHHYYPGSEIVSIY